MQMIGALHCDLHHCFVHPWGGLLRRNVTIWAEKKKFCYYGTPHLRCLWLSASNCFSQPNHAICTDTCDIKE